MNFDVRDFGDVLRLIIFTICMWCLILLALRLVHKRHKWNVKTKNYWFAMVMWCLAGCTIAIEGIYKGTEVGPRTIMVTLASVTSLIGLHQRGGWGADE